MFREVLNRIASRGAYRHDPIPPLDGALSSNDRLRVAEPLVAAVTDGPRDIAIDEQRGVVYVTDADRVLRATETDLSDLKFWAQLPAHGTGAALAPDGGLMVGLEGLGLAAVAPSGDIRIILHEVNGHPLRCVTGVAVSPEGQVAVTEGSQVSLPSAWCHDLMAANERGRLIRCRVDGSAAETIASELAYPYGVSFNAAMDQLVFSESWRHRLWAVAAEGRLHPEPLVDNLPGYPARIHADGKGGYWLAIFAMRTQLIEFVLAQRDYCDDMMEQVAPEHWIRPELRPSTNYVHNYLVPLQHGALVALGQKKQSAPPRTYGLVVQLDANGVVLQSLHDREGGPHPGAVAALSYQRDLLVASEGGRRLLRAKLEPDITLEEVQA